MTMASVHPGQPASESKDISSEEPEICQEADNLAASLVLRKSRIAFAADNSASFSRSDCHQVTVDDVFAWLRWAPPAGSPCGEALGRTFPGALPSSAVLRRLDEVLKSVDPTFTPKNVLHGQSVCPDEINHQKDSLATRMANRWGKVFPMGGIGGAPYVGKTGYAAFSHHVSRRFACVHPCKGH